MRGPWKAVSRYAIRPGAERRNRRNPLKGKGGGTPAKTASYGRIRTIEEVVKELVAENRVHGRR